MPFPTNTLNKYQEHDLKYNTRVVKLKGERSGYLLERPAEKKSIWVPK